MMEEVREFIDFDNNATVPSNDRAGQIQAIGRRVRVLKIQIIAILLSASLSSCEFVQDGKCESMGFENLDEQKISSIKVYDNRRDGMEEQPLVVIDNEEKIAAITKFLKERNEDWLAPWGGVPVGQLRVVFWNNDARIRAFSVGNSFIEAQGCGYFFIKNISAAERNQILELLELEFEFE